MRLPRTTINKKARKSAVWRYFDDFGDVVHVYCLLCAAGKKETILNNADGHTSGLWEHMKSKHKSEWEEIKDKMRKLPKKSSSLEGSQNKSLKPEDNIKTFENNCGPKNDVFPCNLCRITFTSKRTLSNHNSNEHTRRTSLNVDILAIESFDQLDPSVRLLSGMSNEDKASKQVWFDNLKTILKKLDTKHLEIGTQTTKDFKGNYIVSDNPVTNCPKSDDFFKTNWAMQKHKASVHKEDNIEDILESMVERKDAKWFCGKCGKQQKHKFHVKRHAEIHLVGIVHACAICEKGHTTRNSLKQHVVTYHSTSMQKRRIKSVRNSFY